MRNLSKAFKNSSLRTIVLTRIIHHKMMNNDDKQLKIIDIKLFMSGLTLTIAKF